MRHDFALVAGEQDAVVAHECPVLEELAKHEAEPVPLSGVLVEVDHRPEDAVGEHVGKEYALPGAGDGVRQVVFDRHLQRDNRGVERFGDPPHGKTFRRGALDVQNLLRLVALHVGKAGYLPVPADEEPVAVARFRPRCIEEGPHGFRHVCQLEIGDPVLFQRKVYGVVPADGIDQGGSLQVSGCCRVRGRRRGGFDGRFGGGRVRFAGRAL